MYFYTDYITTGQAERMVEYLHQVMLEHLYTHNCFTSADAHGCDEYEALYELQKRWAIRAARLEMRP